MDEIAQIFAKLRADVDGGKTGTALDVAFDTALLQVRSAMLRASARHGGDIVTTRRGKA